MEELYSNQEGNLFHKTNYRLITSQCFKIYVKNMVAIIFNWYNCDMVLTFRFKKNWRKHTHRDCSSHDSKLKFYKNNQ